MNEKFKKLPLRSGVGVVLLNNANKLSKCMLLQIHLLDIFNTKYKWLRILINL